MWRQLLTLARLVVNAAPSALLTPVLLLALILILNPDVSPTFPWMADAWATLVAAYGLPLLVGLPAGFAAVRFFAVRHLRIRWFHLKAVVWYLAAGLTPVLAVFALNLWRNGALIGPRARYRLVLALVIMLGSWAAATVLASLAQFRRGVSAERNRWIALALLVGCAPAVLAVRGSGGLREPPRLLLEPEIASRSGPLVVIAIEGASFADVLPLVSEGRLPHLSRMLKEGAHGALRTIRPCRSAAAWASLATGKLPARTGVKDVRIYELEGLPADLRLAPEGLFFRQWLSTRWLRSRPVGEADLRARPLWQILDRMRVATVALRWPLSGVAVPAGLEEETTERHARARAWLARLRRGEPAGGAQDPKAEAEILAAVTGDLAVHDTLLRVASASSPRFLGAYLPGLGAIGASFVKFERPGQAPGVAEEEIERYGHVLDRYYEMLDALVGEVRAWLPDEGYLMIVSAYGTEPLGPLDRLQRRIAGLQPVAGGHDAGPAGILMLQGPGVAAGKQVDELGVIDVVPLCLYLLGMPVGRDMDGRLPRRLFERSFLEANPITFIPTYG